MKTSELEIVKSEIERKSGRIFTSGQFALLLGYAKKSRDAREAYSRYWELARKEYLPSSIEHRIDELRKMTAAKLRKEIKSLFIKSAANAQEVEFDV